MNNLTVYLLDDCEEDQYLFRKTLGTIEDVNFTVKVFLTLQDLSLGLAERQPDIVVTDLNLPESIGLETFLKVKKMAPMCPIVIMTGGKDNIALKAIQLGAQDYILKNELRSSILKRTLLFAKERFLMHKTLEELAIRDKLTRLYNREAFDKKIRQQFEECHRYKIGFAILFIDLNDFKQINDTYGHLIGDKLLQLIASRINSFNRVSDFTARIGGDEFVIIANHVDSSEELHNLIEYKRKTFCGSYVLESVDHELIELDVSMSFGGALAGLDGDTPESLIQIADKKMYQDKEGQKRKVVKTHIEDRAF